MAQLINVKLSRFDSQPWGFRLQGGIDFGSPLLIQKVTGGSLAEKAGLQAGDSVIRVNSVDLFSLRHKEAQDAIVRAGNNFEITVQRGGGTWKPNVAPVGPTPTINSAAPAGNIAPVTKTSLAARPQASAPIASGYNVAAKPFGGAQVNGDPTVKSIVNKQYNTPVGIYSEETIAETLSAQAEVLAGGVLGVNFKKNERHYDPGNSEVLKLLQEIDNEPAEARPPSTTFYSASSHAIGGTPRPLTPMKQRLPASTAPNAPSPVAAQPADSTKCTDCEKPIVGAKAPAGAISAALAGAPGLRQGPSPAAAPAPPRPAPAPAPAPVAPAPAPAPVAPGSPQTLGPVPFHQPPSSVAPPKPAGAPTAPTTSPARPAQASNRLVWPPKEEEGLLPGPTATPLYIPPVPLEQRQIPALPAEQTFASNITQLQQQQVQQQQQQFQQRPNPTQPIVPPTPQNPQSAQAAQSTVDQVSAFPLPYSDFISTHKAYQMRSVSSPTPPSVPLLTPNLPQKILLPTSNLKMNESSSIQTETNISETLMQSHETRQQHMKKASVCSQEVSLITTSKSVAAAEKITETLETQSLVSSIIQGGDRPASPVPTKSEETPQIPQPNPESKNEEQPNMLSEPNLPEVQPVQTEVKDESVIMEVQTVESSSILESSVREQEQNTQVSQETIIESAPVISIPTENITDVSATSALPPPFPLNTTPKQWQSSMLEALTTASDRPYSPFPAATHAITMPTQSTTITQQPSLESSLAYKQLPVQPAVAFRPIALDQQAPQQPDISLGVQSPSIPAPVPLPKETAPYKPKFEIEPRSESCPSPMVSALTIASNRPFSPLPPATIPQTPTSIVCPTTTVSKIEENVPLPSVKPPETCEPELPLLPIPSKQMSMLEALTYACDRPYSPFTAPSPSSKTVVQSEASAFTAVTPQAVTTGPKFPSPKPTPSLINTIKPLPTSTIPVQKSITPIPIPRPASRSALPVMGGFRPTVLPGTSQDSTEDYLSSLSQTMNLSTQSPLVTTTTSVEGGRVVTRTTRVSEEFSHSHKEMQKTIERSLGKAPKVTSSQFQQQFEHSSQSQQKFVNNQEVSRTQQQKQHLSSFGSQKPQSLPFYQKDIERFREQRALSPGPHSQQMRALSPIPQGLRPSTPTITPTPRFTSVKQAASSFESSAQDQSKKLCSLPGAKPAAIPFYQKDIERYQMQRTISPSPLARQSPQIPATQSLPGLKQQQQQQKSNQKIVQKSAGQPNQSFGLPKPSVIPAYQHDIERFQIQRALSPAPHFQNVRALSPTPQQIPQELKTGRSQTPVSFPDLPLPQKFPDASGLNINQTVAHPVFKPTPTPSQPVSLSSIKPSVAPAQPSSTPTSAFRPTAVTKTPAPSTSSIPNAGGGGGVGGGVGGGPGQKGSATFAGSTAPRRGQGVLNQQTPGARIPLCGFCNNQIRGPFITALGKIWCPEHFVCVNGQCRRPLQDIGFVEEKGELYCEYCFEQFIAPPCDKCSKKIKEDCLNAIGKHFHPECFLCAYCGKLFGNTPFFLEDGLPYCEADWNELFTTKCFACGFPIEAGDRWVEALNNNYHSQCFNCTNCKKNLEGQSFYAKGGRPFCKAHAR